MFIFILHILTHNELLVSKPNMMDFIVFDISFIFFKLMWQIRKIDYFSNMYLNIRTHYKNIFT